LQLNDDCREALCQRVVHIAGGMRLRGKTVEEVLNLVVRHLRCHERGIALAVGANAVQQENHQRDDEQDVEQSRRIGRNHDPMVGGLDEQQLFNKRRISASSETASVL
jgi:hypothetical protein